MIIKYQRVVMYVFCKLNDNGFDFGFIYIISQHKKSTILFGLLYLCNSEENYKNKSIKTSFEALF